MTEELIPTIDRNSPAYTGHIHIITPEEWDEHTDDDGDSWFPQCSATTKKGERCKRYIFGGQVYFYLDDKRAFLYEEDYELFKAGHCAVHRR